MLVSDAIPLRYCDERELSRKTTDKLPLVRVVISTGEGFSPASSLNDPVTAFPLADADGAAMEALRPVSGPEGNREGAQ
jgi:hypothetical protein